MDFYVVMIVVDYVWGLVDVFCVRSGCVLVEVFCCCGCGDGGDGGCGWFVVLGDDCFCC